ncbi:MAG: hypothetical protein SFU56_16800 [Capsulimonadales bacterium]|nr:hypothetical protein [Capsulimonadales bacterium]
MKQGIYQRLPLALLAGIVVLTVGVVPASAQQSASKSRKRSAAVRSKRTTTTRTARQGPLVTVSFDNVPVRAALLELFRKGRRDYSIDGDVQGIVNLKATRKPFSDVLRLLSANATTPLTYTVQNGVYFVRPVAIRSVRSAGASVAQTGGNLPEDPARLAEAAEVNTPTVRYPSGVQVGGQAPAFPLGVPGYPGLGFPQNNFGGAFPVYQYPSLYVQPFAGVPFGGGANVFYQTPFVGVGPGTTVIGTGPATVTPVTPTVPNNPVP